MSALVAAATTKEFQGIEASEIISCLERMGFSSRITNKVIADLVEATGAGEEAIGAGDSARAQAASTRAQAASAGILGRAGSGGIRPVMARAAVRSGTQVV